MNTEERHTFVSDSKGNESEVYPMCCAFVISGMLKSKYTVDSI